jgi:nucleotide-binding universal stress UspA family protein
MARILVPFDGGAESERLLDMASRAANDNGDEVHVVYVIRVPRHLPMGADMSAERTLAAALFERAYTIADRYHTCLTAVTVEAREVGPGIVEAARSCECDTIMLELRSRRRFYDRTRLNRTLHHIMTHAPCQILISYPPAVDEVLAAQPSPLSHLANA